MLERPMGTEQPASSKPELRPTYRWPWFVLAAVILAVVLAVLWMSHEIERTRRIRDANPPRSSTR
jgi:hypothetical protein